MPNTDPWVASYGEEAEMLDAIRRLREAGQDIVDVYSPYPIHGLDELLGLGASRIGWVTFAAGGFGAIAAFGLQAWTSAVSWPVNVGGKPNLSTLAFIPITFEATVLCAGLATAAAFLWRSRLYPRRLQPVAAGVTDDRFAIVVDPRQGRLGDDGLLRLLQETGALFVNERRPAS